MMRRALDASTEPPMVIGGEPASSAPRSAACCSRFNGAADGDRRRASSRAEQRPRSRRFNGAADGDRRRVESRRDVIGLALASTEPPMVIGGEAPTPQSPVFPRSLQRSRRW